ncbi:carbohydrate ABC transporter permease [Lachnobacterium bovis]|uniref:Maltose/maltodextrin transport system permease protein n=1 Tax=Lachnobacterium bovis TaxID=140626 RepID=A0A1H9SPG7_9FIRM|nr:sugar ABC transporter permease [Lachnobacterium bovis]SER86303.1 arabinogalactan oligomer / maltooligosaccharide transport system permease protein [Lachnobacterium bovis]
MKVAKQKSDFATPFTVKNAITKGDLFTKLSGIIMGLGNFKNGQFEKSLIYFAIEIGYIMFMIKNGFYYLKMLPTLGTRKAAEVWNEQKQVYEYVQGDNSVLLLLYGVVTIAVTLVFIYFLCDSLKSAYKVQYYKEKNWKIKSFKEDVEDLFDSNLHKLLMFLPFSGILIFTILPLLFMIAMAFTNYSDIGDHLILFDWVGLKNFKTVLGLGGKIGQTFWPVLGWTLIWAFFATFLNFFLGMILAIVINRKETKGKAFWRFCFVISIAIPQFVSLLVMRTLLQRDGAINTLLLNAGLIKTALPFWTNATWARVTVILVNCWVGIPYTMLQVTGILQNVPAELYEAAKIDGANPIQIYFKITLPYIMFIMGPYLITQFTGNINNFNVIYLLSGGAPVEVGKTAGKTDLLVTWLYKLTIDYKYYNLGAVIGILTFIILSIVALVTYRNTASYKDEEGFQ